MNKKVRVKISRVILLFFISFSLNLFAGNPGESAINCVSTSQKADNFTFKNNCGYKIFVLWCGDLKYSKKKCGDGKGYYTQSQNIGAYDSDTTYVKGHIKYAACKGTIGFGRKGFKDYPNGSYICTKTAK